MEEEYESLVASDRTRDNLFLELYVKNQQFAEVYVENGKAIIKIFKPQTADNWEFNYSILQKFILDIDEFQKNFGS